MGKCLLKVLTNIINESTAVELTYRPAVFAPLFSVNAAHTARKTEKFSKDSVIA